MFKEKPWYVFKDSLGDIHAVVPIFDNYNDTHSYMQKSGSQWIWAKTDKLAIAKYRG